MDRFHQLQQYLDNKAKSKVDPSYIEVPDKPWRVILRYKENGARSILHRLLGGLSRIGILLCQVTH